MRFRFWKRDTRYLVKIDWKMTLNRCTNSTSKDPEKLQTCLIKLFFVSVLIYQGFIIKSSCRMVFNQNQCLFSPADTIFLPQIQAAAALLLESKMFYVPFVLNSAEIRQYMAQQGVQFAMYERQSPAPRAPQVFTPVQHKKSYKCSYEAADNNVELIITTLWKNATMRMTLNAVRKS